MVDFNSTEFKNFLKKDVIYIALCTFALTVSIYSLNNGDKLVEDCNIHWKSELSRLCPDVYNEPFKYIEEKNVDFTTTNFMPKNFTKSNESLSYDP